MFKATKPFKDTVTGYDKEPSLRIGKKVPQNAVNLAYYYNPTATDAEKILASDPPRQTIDHRIETQWLTVTDVASGPNGEEPTTDLYLPKYIYHSDEEGYYGRLTRQENTVRWYPEQHVNQKEVTYDNVQIVSKKGDEDKVIEYADADGYKGHLYLDTAQYETYTTKDASITEELDYTINDFELNYHEIFGTYLNSTDMNSGPFSNVPNPMAGEDYCWPARIEITPTKLKCSDSGMPTTNTNNRIANFINNLTNQWDGSNEQFVNNPDIISSSKPVGFLYFDKLEYEPVKYDVEPKDGSISKERKISGIRSDDFPWHVTHTSDQSSYRNQLPTFDRDVKLGGQKPETSYLADMGKGYDEIEDFMVMLENAPGSYQTVLKILQDAIDGGKDIAIWLSDLQFVVNDKTIDMLRDGSVFDGDSENEIHEEIEPSPCHFILGFKYVISDRGTEGTMLYNIVANYHSVWIEEAGHESVTRTITTRKEEATSYRAHCHYSGLVNKNWIDYDGIAFYMGSVTKGNSIGNQNADEDNEIVMFPDQDGYLRQIVEGLKTETDENNRPTYSVEYRSYYRLEADTVYVTDVFKDGEGCFYRYKLKQPIYDYRGPDENGMYKGDAVQVYTSMLKDVPDNYKHNMKLKVAEYAEQTTYDQYNKPTTELIPKCYYAELFTNFVSSSTDTFKVVYNGFNDIDDDNKVLNNGIEEDIYNAPYMVDGVDYRLCKVNRKTRISYIQILNYMPLKDERYRVTFEWQVMAVDKDNNKVFYSEIRQSSILNRDYCIPCEYKDFEGRGMIISPKLNGDSIPCSPRELCMNDQAGYQSADDDYEPVISDTADTFVYSVIIHNINNAGSVNIKCNPDGSGVITAETTVDTGFYDTIRAAYTKKLDMENPYWTDGKYIYQGYKVKCIDSRNIKVKAPREERLLDSWYPMIQFGHFSRIMDQYGAHTKVCYSMPEYDTQHYSTTYGQPYVDVENEQVTILNPHMVKTLCYPLHVLYDENYNLVTMHVFKQIDDELFELTVENVSFTDGVVIIKEAISENDKIIANYTYLEENYHYRGYWRDAADFVRIDLNPNIYHTYNNPNYLPSEVSPSKNLFNKVIYFFLRPTGIYEISADADSLYYGKDGFTVQEVTKTRMVKQPKYRTEIKRWVDKTISDSMDISDVQTAYLPYQDTKQILEFTISDNENTYTGPFEVTMSSGHWYSMTVERLATEDPEGLNDVWETVGFCDTPAATHNTTPLTRTIDEIIFTPGTTYRVLTRECNGGGSDPDQFIYNFSVNGPIQVNIVTRTPREEEQTLLDGFEDVEEEYTGTELIPTDEVSKVISETENCLYHQIDNAEPEADEDMLIGSVYIRQDTSLHSTIITDSRTRGGGVLEAMSDSLRHKLEPESDFYLDIGFYDGKPYQENGVIIVRLDNRILKEYGGRFTTADVEQKVKRWLGTGIYPIIEFVDSYKKEDLPQYTLEIQDNYTNVIDIMPEIFLECVAV